MSIYDPFNYQRMETTTRRESLDVKRFVLKTRKLEDILSGADDVTVAAGGEKLLYKKKDEWFIQGAESPVKAGEGGLKLSDAEVYADPRAEWRQMYRETWRIQRDFLYDPGFHGLDLAAAEKKYAAWLDGLGSRADLPVAQRAPHPQPPRPDGVQVRAPRDEHHVMAGSRQQRSVVAADSA